jgi:sulfur carrier protein ThiS
MKITLKLFAMLEGYLPAGAADNQVRLEVAAGATPEAVFRMLNLPFEACHLVLINGIYVPPSERGSVELKEGDALAAWPPVAGGI